MLELFRTCSVLRGSLKVNSPVLTSATADGLLSNPKCRLPLPAAIYGDYLIQPQVKLKRQPKYFQVYAKLQENGDSGSDGHSTSHDLLNAITKNSEICSSPEKRSAISDDSSCHLDQESHISSLNDELTPDSINYQVCLDKLKAIYLHVLASEQWNASRLNICHRYKINFHAICLSSFNCENIYLYIFFTSFIQRLHLIIAIRMAEHTCGVQQT